MDEQILLLKLRRTEKLNSKFREALRQERISASRASKLILRSVEETPDPLVPTVWAAQLQHNKYRRLQQRNSPTSSHAESASCCTIM